MNSKPTDEKARLSAAIPAKSHKHVCVPWRGAGGDIGACVYCGKKQDAITSYYTDRANSGLAALAR